MSPPVSSTGTLAPMVYNDFSALQGLKGQSRDNPNAAIDEVASQFESLFMNMMLKSMRATLPQDGLLSGGHMGTYQEMFDQQLALDLARHKGFGLAELISRQLNVSQPTAGDTGETNNG